MKSFIPILPEDIISESRKKINSNFQNLALQEENILKQLEQLFDTLNGKVQYLTDTNNENNNKALNKIQELQDYIDTLDFERIDISVEDIKKLISEAVDRAIGGAEDGYAGLLDAIHDNLNGFRDEISNQIGKYATTTTIQTMIDRSINGLNLDGLEDLYTRSAAWDQFMANADERTAAAQMSAANSVFYKDENGYLWYKEPERTTGCKSLEDFYRKISPSIRQSEGFDGLSFTNPDQDKLRKFIYYCESNLKTVFSEISTIRTAVEDGYAEFSLVAAVDNTTNNTDKSKVAASIIGWANETESGIGLNADKINFLGSQILMADKNDPDGFRFVLGKDSSGNPNLLIRTSNFLLDSSGNVSVTGNINATSLTISGNAGTTLTEFIKNVGNSEHWGSSSGGDNVDIDWLTDALQETSIVGGLLLTGNVFVAKSGGNFTAGMMGYDTSALTDIRFFAGTDIANNTPINQISTAVKNAPFRVDESGKLVATNAEITGNITATSLTIQSNGNDKSADQYIRDLISGDINDESGITSVLRDLIIGVGTDKGWNGDGTTPSGITENDIKWLTNAFDKVHSSNGLILAGNMFVGDRDGNVTAGMMGADSDSNDNYWRFFAGSYSPANAPFKVDKNGELYATNAHITGEITATRLILSTTNAEMDFSSLLNQGTINNTLKSIIERVGEEKEWGSSSGSGETEDWYNGALQKTTASGGLILTGNLFVGSSSGAVTAGVMGANTGNDIRFFAGSGSENLDDAPFRVYKDGTLKATKAEISGDITAKYFISSEDVEYKENVSGEDTSVDYEGTIKKTTKIDNNSLTIIADGNLTMYSSNGDGADDEGGEEESGETVDSREILGEKNINNSLYIKLVNSMPNPSGSQITGTSTLLCVPVLCMRYDGVEYMLSPASWINAMGSDTSNMGWKLLYSGSNLTINNMPSSSNTYCRVSSFSSNNKTTKYCLFRTEDKPKNAANYQSFTSGKNTPIQIYKFVVINLGSVTTAKSMLKQANLITCAANASDEVVKSSGVYTYSSGRVNSTISNYVDNSISQTPINQSNINTYKQFLMGGTNNGVSSSVNASKEVSGSVWYESGTSYLDGYDDKSKIRTFGRNITDAVERLLGGGTGIDSRLWKTSEFGGIDGSWATISNLHNNLPFSAGTSFPRSDETMEIDYTIYPIENITGTTHNMTTKMLASFNITISGEYNTSTSNNMTLNEYVDGGDGESKNFKPTQLGMTIQFSLIVDITNQDWNELVGFDPTNSLTDSNLKKFILSLLIEKINYSNLLPTSSNSPCDNYIYISIEMSGNNLNNYISTSTTGIYNDK